jgi:hypothetical protein
MAVEVCFIFEIKKQFFSIAKILFHFFPPFPFTSFPVFCVPAFYPDCAVLPFVDYRMIEMENIQAAETSPVTILRELLPLFSFSLSPSCYQV